MRFPVRNAVRWWASRSEEHTSELQSLRHLVCRLLLEKTIRSEEHTSELQSLRHFVCRVLLEKNLRSCRTRHRGDGTHSRCYMSALYLVSRSEHRGVWPLSRFFFFIVERPPRLPLFSLPPPFPS